MARSRWYSLRSDGLSSVASRSPFFTVSPALTDSDTVPAAGGVERGTDRGNHGCLGGDVAQELTARDGREADSLARDGRVGGRPAAHHPCSGRQQHEQQRSGCPPGAAVATPATRRFDHAVLPGGAAHAAGVAIGDAGDGGQGHLGRSQVCRFSGSVVVVIAGIVPIPPPGCSCMIIRCFCGPVGLNAAAAARPQPSTGHFGGHFL